VNLKEWAAATGVSYATVRRRFEAGTLPVPTYRLGRLIMVGEPVTGANVTEILTALCARLYGRRAAADRARRAVEAATQDGPA
jgi:predicted site-specific integrase-resolvase